MNTLTHLGEFLGTLLEYMSVLVEKAKGWLQEFYKYVLAGASAKKHTVYSKINKFPASSKCGGTGGKISSWVFQFNCPMRSHSAR
jgi:hypothetical protein